MAAVVSNGSFVCPGDVLLKEAGDVSFDLCGGCYLDEKADVVRASLVGILSVEDILAESEEPRLKLSVKSSKNEVASETVIDVGDKVICRVVRISMNLTNVEILSVGDCALHNSPKGIIRREDVRLSDIEKLVMHECFRPGDIVRGVVISLGDSRQYYLSTSDADHGVLEARNLISGNMMEPVSHKVKRHIQYFSLLKRSMREILCRLRFYLIASAR